MDKDLPFILNKMFQLDWEPSLSYIKENIIKFPTSIFKCHTLISQQCPWIKLFMLLSVIKIYFNPKNKNVSDDSNIKRNLIQDFTNYSFLALSILGVLFLYMHILIFTCLCKYKSSDYLKFHSSFYISNRRTRIKNCICTRTKYKLCKVNIYVITWRPFFLCWMLNVSLLLNGKSWLTCMTERPSSRNGLPWVFRYLIWCLSLSHI